MEGCRCLKSSCTELLVDGFRHFVSDGAGVSEEESDDVDTLQLVGLHPLDGVMERRVAIERRYVPVAFELLEHGRRGDGVLDEGVGRIECLSHERRSFAYEQVGVLGSVGFADDLDNRLTIVLATKKRFTNADFHELTVQLTDFLAKRGHFHVVNDEGRLDEQVGEAVLCQFVEEAREGFGGGADGEKCLFRELVLQFLIEHIDGTSTHIAVVSADVDCHHGSFLAFLELGKEGCAGVVGLGR